VLRRHKLLEHPDPWIATAIAAGATTETVAEIHAVAAMTTAVAAVTLEEEVEVTTTTTGIATIHATEVGVDLVVAAVALEREIHETEGGIHEIATRGLAGVEMAQGCREEMEETQGALAVATTASAVTAVTATVSQRAPVAEGDATAPRTGDRHRGVTRGTTGDHHAMVPATETAGMAAIGSVGMRVVAATGGKWTVIGAAGRIEIGTETGSSSSSSRRRSSSSSSSRRRSSSSSSSARRWRCRPSAVPPS
jgi:hypothetical protein